MAVKTKAIKRELSRAIANATALNAPGGTTDGIGEGKEYLAEIVEPVLDCDGNPFSFSTMRYGSLDKPVKCFLYKIKLIEELGNSYTGTQILNFDGPLNTFKDGSSLIKPFFDAGEITEEEFKNITKSLMPEAVFVQDNAMYENPARGDIVEAFADSGIEGRYEIVLTKASKRLKEAFVTELQNNPDAALKNLFGTNSKSSSIKPLMGRHGQPVLDTGDPRRTQLLLDYIRGNGSFAGSSVGGGMIKEATRISSDYGKRKWGMHNGIDIGVPAGPKPGGTLYALRAPCDGIVRLAAFQDENLGSWRNGNFIRFEHKGQGEEGYVSMFLHLYKISEKLRPADGTPATIQNISEIPPNQLHVGALGPSVKNYRIGEERAYWPGTTTLSRLKKENITVTKGEILGYIGNSGRSQGTHLHWQWSARKPDDPYRAVKKWATKNGSTAFGKDDKKEA